MTTPQHIHVLRLRLDALMGCTHPMNNAATLPDFVKHAMQAVPGPFPDLLYKIGCAREDANKAALDAHHALKMAKAWLGNALGELGELGEATPYTVADTAASIPPTADVAPPFALPPGDLLGMTNALRAEVKAVYGEIAVVRMTGPAGEGIGGLFFISLTQAWVYAREASNHLGFLLAAMREYALNSQVAEDRQHNPDKIA